MAVILETSLGDITVDLYTKERPRCSLNFLKLCKVKFYNYCLFHNVQQNLAAQCGDPEGTGRGGQSIYAVLYGEQAAYFEAERKPRIKHTKKGLLSMVNNGHDMHGSQFFFTLSESLDSLDQQGHTVFGEVSEGFEVLDKINEAFCDAQGMPYQNIRVYHTVVLDDPFDDPPGLVIPDASPVPTKQQLDNGRIEADEEIDPYAGKTEAEVKELTEEKEAKANAQLLEMVGDLPDQDVAPPDNVLFVCKLNPVTTDDDLEIIFSRFGPILSCEVIRDFKTKESLQYAFIEFEKPEHCENAYFKMDNVLIDDRRIHVDFSQSVSKIKWKGKGKGVEHVKENNAEEKRVESKPSSSRLYNLDRDVMDRKYERSKDKHSADNKDDRTKMNKSSDAAGYRRDKAGTSPYNGRRQRSRSYERDRYRTGHQDRRPNESRSRDHDSHDRDKSRGVRDGRSGSPREERERGERSRQHVSKRSYPPSPPREDSRHSRGKDARSSGRRERSVSPESRRSRSPAQRKGSSKSHDERRQTSRRGSRSPSAGHRSPARKRSSRSPDRHRHRR